MANMKLPTYSDGVGKELVYPGACMTRAQAIRYGDRAMPSSLKRLGFKTHIFTSDTAIHGHRYQRVTYGKGC